MRCVNTYTPDNVCTPFTPLSPPNVLCAARSHTLSTTMSNTTRAAGSPPPSPLSLSVRALSLPRRCVIVPDAASVMLRTCDGASGDAAGGQVRGAAFSVSCCSFTRLRILVHSNSCQFCRAVSHRKIVHRALSVLRKRNR